MPQATAQPAGTPALDIEAIRSQFPILSQQINAGPLVYLDSGATSQKPQAVIDSLEHYYHYTNANVHRGVHHLSQQATRAYEDARETIRACINAEHAHQIIFTRGTTESINLVASCWGRRFLNADDEVIISTMEHHSNIVPWQMICEERGAKLKIIPINQRGELRLDAFEELLSSRTRLVAITHVSNTLGTINPVKQIIDLAHARQVAVLLDGAQAIPHMRIDVQELDADFYAFSGHKVFGPTGVGVLYGKTSLLDAMPPYQGGGEMIERVKFEKTTFNVLPHKFEAGTPNIAGGIALGTAINYLSSFDYEELSQYEEGLMDYAQEKLKAIEGVRFIGEAEQKVSVISFIIEGQHHFDVGTLLDKQGIAVRTGHHCTQPVMDHFDINGTIRVSFAFYNTKEEVDLFISALERALNMLR